MAEKVPQTYFINPLTIVGSTYAQMVSVARSTDGMVTLDFVFKHPRDPNEGQVVGRVTIPLGVAQDLQRVLKSVVEADVKKEKTNGKKNSKKNK